MANNNNELNNPFILQWNARSAAAKIGSLNQTLSSSGVIIAAISETWFHPNRFYNISNYNVIRQDRHDSRGGSALLIKKPYTFKKISIQQIPGCDICGAEVYIQDLSISIVSIYNPPNNRIHPNELLSLFSISNRNLIICGDLNGHHITWGNNYNDTLGVSLLNAIEDCNLVILNDGSPTRINYPQQNPTAVDITLATPDICDSIRWKISDDSLGSDHFLIYLTLNEPLEETNVYNTRKWNLKKANWPMYQSALSDEIEKIPINEVSYTKFVNAINKAALKSIPTLPTFKKNVKPPNPWWTETCSELVNERKRALKLYTNNITYDNFINYQKVNAQTKKFLKSQKRASWIKFCSRLNRNTPISSIWNTLRRFKNYDCSKNTENNTSEWLENFVDSLAPPFVTNRLNDLEPDGNLHPNHPISKEITLEELILCTKNRFNTAPGKDNIHYLMLENLPYEAKLYLLKIYNYILTSGTIPPEWSDVIIVPVLKGNKNPNDEASYRPISLLSCTLKTFERILKIRLEWWIESRGLLPCLQFGYRKNCSTMDNLAIITSDIYRCFANKQSTFAFMADIAGAYDSIDIDLLSQSLSNIEIPSKIINIISSVFYERRIYIRYQGELVGPRTAYKGICQGAILAPILFSIYTSDFESYISSPGNTSLMFADDICFYNHETSEKEGIEKIKNTTSKFLNWLEDKGLEISPPKSTLTIFSRKHKNPSISHLEVGEFSFPVRNEVKFLGIQLDRKLNRASHVNTTIQKCEKKLNIIRMLTRTWWGADPKILRTMYQAIIRSQLDYGCFIFGGINKKLMNKINSIQYKGLRLIIGAMRSTPTNALQIECNEMPWHLRNQLLGSRFIMKRIQIENHTVIEKITKLRDSMDSNFWSGTKPVPPLIQALNSTRPFTHLVKQQPLLPVFTYEIPIHLHEINTDSSLQIPKCLWNRPTIIDPLVQLHIDTINPRSYVVYTDGSKHGKEDAVGSAIFDPQTNVIKHFKSPKETSIFSAECLAILEAIKHAVNSENTIISILTDSLSIINALENIHLNATIYILEIRNEVFKAYLKGIYITFIWVKGHIGCSGNETVDRAANEAINKNEYAYNRVSISDLRLTIKEQIINKWQVEWNLSSKDRGYKYSLINPNVGITPWFEKMNIGRRSFYSCLSRMRLGHGSYPAHLKRIGVRDDDGCSCDPTVVADLEHILFGMSIFRERRF